MPQDPYETPIRGSHVTRVLQQPVTLDAVLKIFGTILLTITSAISGWTLLKILDHDGRIIRVETREDGRDEVLKEMKEDLKDIKKALQDKKP